MEKAAEKDMEKEEMAVDQMSDNSNKMEMQVFVKIIQLMNTVSNICTVKGDNGIYPGSGFGSSSNSLVISVYGSQVGSNI
jgi:homoserine kinase